MKRHPAIALILLLAVPLLNAGPAPAQEERADTIRGQIPPNPNIKIAYVPPSEPALVPLYERLRARKVLESMQQFLSPLVLTQDIEVRFEQCGAPELRHESGGPAIICYEYVEQIERMAPEVESVDLAQGTVTREETIVGPTVQAVLHQAALAVFDALDVPIWGRRADAADRVAAYIMMQFGEQTAWSTVLGTAWFLAGSAGAPADFADVRGTVAQRYYTMLCIGLGSPLSFSSGAPLFSGFYGAGAAGNLPRGRAVNCRREYAMLERGFNETLAAHIDPAKLELVRSRPTYWIGYRR